MERGWAARSRRWVSLPEDIPSSRGILSPPGLRARTSRPARGNFPGALRERSPPQVSPGGRPSVVVVMVVMAGGTFALSPGQVHIYATASDRNSDLSEQTGGIKN